MSGSSIKRHTQNTPTARTASHVRIHRGLPRVAHAHSPYLSSAQEYFENYTTVFSEQTGSRTELWTNDMSALAIAVCATIEAPFTTPDTSVHDLLPEDSHLEPTKAVSDDGASATSRKRLIEKNRTFSHTAENPYPSDGYWYQNDEWEVNDNYTRGTSPT